MKIDIEYPEVPRQKIHKYRIRRTAWLVVIALCVAAVIVNITVGGKAWSLLACFGAFAFWKIFLCPDLVEFNMISQTMKPLIYIVIILFIIDIFITPDSAQFIVPIVCFGTLTLGALFFFINIRRRKFAAMPLMWCSLFGMIFLLLAICGVIEISWPLIVFGSLGLALALAGFIFFPRVITQELKRRFHLK